MSGHSFLSSYGTPATECVAWITSLRHSSTTIASVESNSCVFQVGNWKKLSQRCGNHFRYCHVCSSGPKTKWRLSFPTRSWVGLPHVCGHLSWITFHSRDYRNYFCLPPTLYIFTF